MSRAARVAGRTADYARAVPRHFLTGEELAHDELLVVLERALALKAARGDGTGRAAAGALAGRSVALIFDKPSTRTRVSFEVAVAELGGHPLVLREGETQLARGESPRDTALVLSRLVHAAGVRTGPHALLEELTAHSQVPIVNLLSAAHHPCQALADLLTLRERFGAVKGLRLAYVGDGNNVAASLMLLGARAGVRVAVATPPELAPAKGVVAAAERSAAAGGEVELTVDPVRAAAGAHAVYTDVWVSMGDEAEATRRRELLAPYRLDTALLARARAEAVVLHCLPAHPGEEIEEDLLYGERSAVWEQAENRLHAQKALLELLMVDRPR
jgi:ornithine carbamoyltransferase